MKEVVEAAGVPTARYADFDDPDEAIAYLDTLSGPPDDGGYVIKTDGLAAGKGVFVTDDRAAAEADIRDKLAGTSFGDAGLRVVVEEKMTGPELSILAVCDGQRAVALAPAQDFKRVGDGDTGPNTGGMGSYSPVPAADDAVVQTVLDDFVHPTLAELRRRGIDYRGVLYAGLMLTPDGPKLVEYNVRFGDPESQVVLPRLTSDLAALLAEAAAGELRTEPTFTDDACVAVALRLRGLPRQHSHRRRHRRPRRGASGGRRGDPVRRRARPARNRDRWSPPAGGCCTCAARRRPSPRPVTAPTPAWPRSPGPACTTAATSPPTPPERWVEPRRMVVAPGDVVSASEQLSK